MHSKVGANQPFLGGGNVEHWLFKLKKKVLNEDTLKRMLFYLLKHNSVTIKAGFISLNASLYQICKTANLHSLLFMLWNVWKRLKNPTIKDFDHGNTPKYAALMRLSYYLKLKQSLTWKIIHPIIFLTRLFLRTGSLGSVGAYHKC